MNDTLFYTLPQWFIFSSIFVITYGWVENKKVFRIIGAVILALLGVFSLFILSGDYFAGSEFLTAEEIAREELDDEIMNEVPFQAQLLPAYISFVVAALVILPGLIFDLKDNKKYRWFYISAGLIVLFGFFIIIGALRSL